MGSYCDGLDRSPGGAASRLVIVDERCGGVHDRIGDAVDALRRGLRGNDRRHPVSNCRAECSECRLPLAVVIDFQREWRLPGEAAPCTAAARSGHELLMPRLEPAVDRTYRRAECGFPLVGVGISVCRSVELRIGLPVRFDGAIDRIDRRAYGWRAMLAGSLGHLIKPPVARVRAGAEESSFPSAYFRDIAKSWESQFAISQKKAAVGQDRPGWVPASWCACTINLMRSTRGLQNRTIRSLRAPKLSGA